MADALVDQPGFLAPGNHFNRETERLFGQGQKLVPVARLAQRLRGHGPHFGGFEARQTLAKPRQAVHAALHRLWREVALFVHAIALAHGFFEVFGAEILAVVDVSDFKAEAVRTQIYGGKAGDTLCLGFVWNRGAIHGVFRVSGWDGLQAQVTSLCHSRDDGVTRHLTCHIETPDLLACSVTPLSQKGRKLNSGFLLITWRCP